MQDYLKGGLKVKKIRARKRARNFFSHALFNCRISFITSPGLLFFRPTGMGSSPPPIMIGGGLLNEGAFILHYCRVAPNF